MKKIQLLKIVCASLILVSMSCKKAEETPAETAKPTFDLAAEKTAVEAGYREFEKAFNAKDSVTLANCYATDAKFMPQSSKAVEGRPAIQKEFTQWFKGDTPQIAIKLVELWGNETNLTAENSWTMTGKDGKVVDEGKSIELYKKEEGKWKLLRDCYNSNMPQAK
ncbi:SgcJ/EcaC family oxidoreductase [Flavobacterium paronense]|uniref:YybH family protein n=1 Tax=Flavobacterium paronense TaxID=1392775 RepID=A0ABV5GB26_9FLAO|nr:SgcJ/EcaC family oxidoreductase [Flavobacterium paronense]MDN3675792.1 SgcJ/EcaC family oxidoreductase [Flavobacterium paronense]MDN3676832.1 SgcJ/EcaC family oxidoreductase [Flavobacterium paronense]